MADQENNQDRDDQKDEVEALQREEAELKVKEAKAKEAEAGAADESDNDDAASGKEDKNSGEDAKAIKAELERVRKALSKANKEAEKYRHEAKPWRDLDVDPETVSEWAREREEAEVRKAEERGEWEKLRERQQEKHQKELQAKEEDLNRMRSTMESYLVDAQTMSALSKYDGDAELAMPHIKPKLKSVQEGDRYEVRVVDEKGEPRTNENGDYLTINDLVAEMKESPVYGKLFNAPNKSGAGTNQNSQKEGQKRIPKKARLSMTSNEKQAFIAEHGFEAYQALPAR